MSSERSHPLSSDRPGLVVRDLRARLEQGGAAADRLGLRLELGTALFAQSRHEEAIRELRALLAERELDERDRASANAVLAGALVKGGRLDEGIAAGLATLASSAADLEAIVLARSAIRGAHFFAGRYEETVAEARVIVGLSEDAGSVARGEARLDMGGMLYHADEFAEAERWLTLDDTFDRYQRQEAAETLGAMELMRGRWNAVLDRIGPAGVADDPDLPDRARAFRPGLRAHALIHLDRLEQARRELDAARRWNLAPIGLVAAALLAEADHEIGAAASHAERAVALESEPGFRPQLRMWGLELVRLALLAGDRATAIRGTQRLEAATSTTNVRSVHAVARAARGMVERDPGLLAEAAAEFAASPRVPAHAQTLEALGLVQREVGETAAALLTLREALRLWQSTEATRDVRRLTQAMADMGVRTRPRARTAGRTGWQSLTPTEATVATLIAEGFSNAEIAHRLVISRRTAESHVAHVLAKLDVPSRAAVGRVLATRGERR